jgi:hypothetical protein
MITLQYCTNQGPLELGTDCLRSLISACGLLMRFLKSYVSTALIVESCSTMVVLCF